MPAVTRGGAGADELAIDFDHAGVAGLMGPTGGEVADLGDADAAVRGGGAIDGLDKGLARLGGNRLAVDLDRSIRSQDDRSIQQWLRVIFSVVHSR